MKLNVISILVWSICLIICSCLNQAKDRITNFLSVCFECGNTKQSKYGNANFYEMCMIFNTIGLPVFDRVSIDDPHYEYYYSLVKKKKDHLKTSK